MLPNIARFCSKQNKNQVKVRQGLKTVTKH